MGKNIAKLKELNIKQLQFYRQNQADSYFEYNFVSFHNLLRPKPYSNLIRNSTIDVYPLISIKIPDAADEKFTKE